MSFQPGKQISKDLVPVDFIHHFVAAFRVEFHGQVLSAGIPEEILLKYRETCVRIPMIGEIRSLNLGNSVAIMLYEALRQNRFEGMNLEGHLHRHDWSEADQLL